MHGITEAGQDVRCELVQVLQNRLDDAVLDFLSVMLARNSMCPLTPEDVHFLQKPFRPPEHIIRVRRQITKKMLNIRFVCVAAFHSRMCSQVVESFYSLFEAKLATVFKHSKVHRFEDSSSFQSTIRYLLRLLLNCTRIF